MGTRFAALVGRHTTGALAAALKMSVGTISRWKSSVMLPAPEHYTSIAVACGVTVDEVACAITEDRVDRSRARRENKQNSATV